ncbi:MAG: NAD(P)H-dependent oxidoreductase [Alphaproteobacteria bacterium]|nr:NAD(P)H-dependent oxidoreductase [Alphaproteobacteria bacterium]
MTRRIVLLDGHPDPDEGRFVHALASAYRNGAQEAGHEVRSIALARLDFPILRSKDEFETGQLPAALVEAQEAVRWGEHLAIFFPLWLGTMPALLKGFLEQICRPGFAFEQTRGFPSGALKGRSARIVVTMGMPAPAFRVLFGAHGLKNLEVGILGFAGIRPIRETLVGTVDGSPHARSRALTEMVRLGSLGR